MEGLIGLLILGFCVWMILRHPLKSLSFLFKMGFLSVLGLGAFLVLWVGLTHTLTPHPPHFLPDFPYETHPHHTLPDDCRASWKCGGEFCSTPLP